MLHKLIDDMHLLFICMAGAGVLGVLGMVITNLTYRRKVKKTSHLSDLKEKWLNLWKSRDILLHRMNRWVWYPSLLCVLIMGCALIFLSAPGKSPSVAYIYAGAGIPLLLLLFRQALDFSYKEELMVDSLADYMGAAQEGMEGEPETVSAMQQAQMVDQIAASIRESAAAGSKFSKLLSPEEEELMREIIKEFMSQG